MNFILFTNQNSSLGQLHSDGGVDSIVCSSAGNLLLVYLSARQLRSSGYYPKYKNGALSSGFWARGIKRSHMDWDPVNRGLRNHRNAFFCQKLIDGYCRVAWGVVVVHAMPGRTRATLFLSIQGLPDKKFDWQFVLVAQIPCGRLPDCQKNKWASIWFWICSFSLSWDGESLQCATPDFGVLSRGRTPKSMIHHLW